MKSLNNYLDLYKELNNMKSDYELSKKLGITRAAVSIIRSGGGVNRENAIKIAEGTKKSLEVIWLASLAQKEQNPIFKKALENISNRIEVITSFLAVTALNIYEVETIYRFISNSVKCILCKIRILSCCNESVPE